MKLFTSKNIFDMFMFLGALCAVVSCIFLILNFIEGLNIKKMHNFLLEYFIAYENNDVDIDKYFDFPIKKFHSLDNVTRDMLVKDIKGFCALWPRRNFLSY